MKSFSALVHREFLEHRGAFFIGPLILVGILFGATLLAFTVGRISARLSGSIFTFAPTRIYEIGFLGLCFAWLLYLVATLMFYCADGFAADKRNNALLFWKSMPVSDFKVLLSKLFAALTILPGMVYAIALLSGILLFGVAFTTTMILGTGTWASLGGIASIYGQIALSFLVMLLCGLLWYLPFMGIIGGLATALGRWAIPVTFLLLAVISTLEWVTIGGIHPFDTNTWRFLEYRASLPPTPYLEGLFQSAAPFSGPDFAADLIANLDWPQVAIGLAVALLAILIASEFRRRGSAN